MKRVLRQFVGVLACVAAGCGGHSDNDNPELPPSGARFEAEVRWTQYGLPHVTARDYGGLGYGYGFAVARDQMCLLADRVRTLRGERSAQFGADGRALVGFMQLSNLDSDLFYRVQLSEEEVMKAWEDLSGEAQALAEGYAAGFNRHLREMGAQMIAQACDGVAPLTMRASDVLRATMQIGTLWKAFRVAPYASVSQWDALTDGAVPGSVPKPRQQMASNAWAFGAEATGGSAIMVANPHTVWEDHWLLMHPMHLTIPGEIDVMGADFIGLPVPLAGFTRDIAWSLEAPSTITYPLSVAMDLRLTSQPSYVVDGVAHPLERREVDIDVRQDDGTVSVRRFTIPYSHLGPLYHLPTGWHAVTDPNEGNARGIDQMLAVAKARNIAEFKQAVERHRGITAHLIAGDRNGDVMYIESGPLLALEDIQLRDCAAGPVVAGVPAALDGTRSACTARDAQGKPELAPSNRLPALGTRGVVHNANDSYAHAVVGRHETGYSALLGNPQAQPNPRTRQSVRQIQDAMDRRGRIGVEEATNMVFGNRNLAAETMLDAILAACIAKPGDSDVAHACAVLSAWDRRQNPGSRGALLFNELWPRLAAIPDLYATSFDPARPFQERAVSHAPTVTLRVAESLGDTARALRAQGLRGDEPWGQMLARVSPAGRVPLHGGADEQGVLNVLETGPFGPEGYADVISGTAYMHVVTWEAGRDAPLAGMLVANGISAALPERDSQLQLFSARQLFKPPFTDAEISADPALVVRSLRE